MSQPGIPFQSRQIREKTLIFVVLCGVIMCTGSGCGLKRQSEPSETAADSNATSYDAETVRAMTFEEWLVELTALPGDRATNINRYAGARIHWQLNYLAAEINTAYDEKKAVSPTNWQKRYRMFSARLRPEVDFSDIMESSYPFQVVAIPDMGNVETHLERGTALNVEAAIWGADGSETIFLKDFLITATPKDLPPAADAASAVEESAPEAEESHRFPAEHPQTDLRETYRPVAPKNGDSPRGYLSKEIIRRTIHRHINEVKFCYEQESATDKKLGGFRGFKLIIDGNGSVADVVILQDTAHEQVNACMTTAVKKWRFPAPDGGGPVIVTYPLNIHAPE